MAAPDTTDILNMTGVWSLNSHASDNLDATFAVQGVPWIVRRVIAFARIEIEMIQRDPDSNSNSTNTTATVIDIKQTVRPGGFDTANQYILDGEIRTDNVPIFGAMSMRARYVGRAEVNNALGASSLEREIEYPLGSSEDGEEVMAIEETSEGKNTGWKTVAVWGFERVDGGRRFCKYCITTKGDRKAEARLVYNYRALPTSTEKAT